MGLESSVPDMKQRWGNERQSTYGETPLAGDDIEEVTIGDLNRVSSPGSGDNDTWHSFVVMERKGQLN